jgi:SAM-dependent methyltransferase
MKALLRRLHAPVYEKRLAVLAELLGGHLVAGESLLDVGCGSGRLGALLGERHGVAVEGLEVQPRGDGLLPVTAYDGVTFPFADDAFDSILLADILHHERDPARVLREAARVARRRVLVKDHKIDGLLAWPRLSFIDWAANAGYEVPCLYQYYSGEEWSDLFRACGLHEERVLDSIDLYPTGLNLLFGKRLQYLAVLTTNPEAVPA